PRHLQVVAEDPVVADLERRDAGALAFARLQAQNVALAVAGQRAEAVELGIDAGGDHASFVEDRRGSLFEEALELGAEAGERIERGDLQEERRLPSCQLGEDRRQLGEAVAEGRRLPRRQRSQDGAAEQALGVAGPRQALAQALAPRVVAGELADRLVAIGDRPGIAERAAQPVAQGPPPGGGDGAGEDGEQGAPALALALAAEDLEVGERRSVEDQPVAGLAEGEAADVRELAPLRLTGVGQGRRRRAYGRLALLEPEAAQGRRPALARQHLAGAPGGEEAVAFERRSARALA